MTRLLYWLFNGNDELVLPREWLENRARLREYDRWTRRQRFQGTITADVAEMRRRAFWAYQAEKHEARRLRAVTPWNREAANAD